MLEGARVKEVREELLRLGLPQGMDVDEIVRIIPLPVLIFSVRAWLWRCSMCGIKAIQLPSGFCHDLPRVQCKCALSQGSGRIL